MRGIFIPTITVTSTPGTSFCGHFSPRDWFECYRLKNVRCTPFTNILAPNHEHLDNKTVDFLFRLNSSHIMGRNEPQFKRVMITGVCHCRPKTWTKLAYLLALYRQLYQSHVLHVFLQISTSLTVSSARCIKVIIIVCHIPYIGYVWRTMAAQLHAGPVLCQ